MKVGTAFEDTGSEMIFVLLQGRRDSTGMANSAGAADLGAGGRQTGWNTHRYWQGVNNEC